MKKIILFTTIILLLAGAFFAYWYFMISPKTPTTGEPGTNSGGFNPINRPGSNTGNNNNQNTNNQISTSTNTNVIQNNLVKIPTLRLLSNTPVGGYGASTTASTTVFRWVDRGRGNVFEARGNTLDIKTISNTVVPKIYEGMWNKNLTSFIASTLMEEDEQANTIFAELIARVIPKTATTTTTSSLNSAQISGSTNSLTPYELRGKNLPKNIISYAVSPKKDKLFMFLNDDGTGVGFISSFDGKNPVQLFTTPLTQVNVEWPTDNIITITTKGAASERGFMYFVDTKTGIWKKILGPLPGLSTKTSKDGKNVLLSVTGSSQNVVMSIYNVASGAGTDAVIRSLAEKCTWGNFYKELVYCGVPSQTIRGIYPDDWYKGTLSTVDQIWQVNANSGNVKLISSIVDSSDRVIDILNIDIDEKDDFLMFMNKNDLSLWSLDLISN